MFKPIIHRPAYTSLLGKRLHGITSELIYDRVLDILQVAEEDRTNIHKENSYEEGKDKHKAIKEALVAGLLMLDAGTGMFSGSFSAAISQEIRGLNGRWRNNTKTFEVRGQDLPLDILAVAADSSFKRKSAHDAVLGFIEQAKDGMAHAELGLDLQPTLKHISEDLHGQFKGTVAGRGLWVSDVPAQLISEAEESIEESVKAHVSHALTRMERETLRNKESGANIKTLKRIVENERDTADKRMDMLADQSVSEFVAHNRKALYVPAGLTSYIWQTREDERVRDGHRALNQRVFSWNEPPIVNPYTGKRCHPGEDMNCRCIAIPVL